MRFGSTSVSGAYVVEIEPHRDHRGYFARTWCTEEFAREDLPRKMVQSSLSHNDKRGTVRGMHLQLPPSQEGKLVRCIRGRIYDVIVDLRPESPTYRKHFGIELTARAHNALYIPPTVLHGFQTLDDDTEVFYQMTDFYAPELTFGARWDDSAFDIEWPIEDGVVIMERDASYPAFDQASYERLVVAARRSGT